MHDCAEEHAVTVAMATEAYPLLTAASAAAVAGRSGHKLKMNESHGQTGRSASYRCDYSLVEQLDSTDI